MKDFVICPYCGHSHDPGDSDGLLYDQDTTEYECGECGRMFNVQVRISYSWDTSPKGAMK